MWLVMTWLNHIHGIGDLGLNEGLSAHFAEFNAWLYVQHASFRCVGHVYLICDWVYVSFACAHVRHDSFICVRHNSITFERVSHICEWVLTWISILIIVFTSWLTHMCDLLFQMWYSYAHNTRDSRYTYTSKKKKHVMYTHESRMSHVHEWVTYIMYITQYYVHYSILCTLLNIMYITQSHDIRIHQSKSHMYTYIMMYITCTSWYTYTMYITCTSWYCIRISWCTYCIRISCCIRISWCT